MIYRATIIDQTFIRYEESEDKDLLPKLIISKPGVVERGVYYPPESVTLFGRDLIAELHRYVHELTAEKEQTNGTNSTPKPEEYINPNPTVPEIL